MNIHSLAFSTYILMDLRGKKQGKKKGRKAGRKD
jgi:hypothetical protein